jgi:GNAT superfamily N-acetyltransferase
MEAVSRLDLKELKPEDREELELYTQPEFRCCLEGKDPFNIHNALIIAVGSRDIGLALASYYHEMNFALIHSIQAKDNTEEKLSTLLERLEKELVGEGANTATFRFYDDGKQSIPLWNVLKERKWAEPELFIIKYFLNYTFNPPWLRKPKPFPKGFEAFPWKELKPEERKDIISRIKEGSIPVAISPFGENENIIEHMNSFGLRHEEKVIGWVVTYRVAHDTIAYTSLYMEPEFQHTGYPMRLLADAININKSSPVTHAMFTINFDQSNVKWINFIERRLAPYAVDTAKIFKSWKTLTKDEGTKGT